MSPDDASVYVDDSLWGSGGDGRDMTLRWGHHSIEVVRPGFDTVHRDVEVMPGQAGELHVEMQRR